MAIEEGDTVNVDYTGTFDDGNVFDTSEGKAPIEFEVGKHMVIKGFEQAVIGMEKGGSKEIKLTPEEAYGQRNDNLVQEVPRDKIPLKGEVKEGMMLVMKTAEGQQVGAIVKKLTDATITVDFNHPLAGKNLNFKLTIADVKKKEA